MEVNGKFYNLWGQFVGQADKWKGGTLQDLDAMMETTITDIQLRPNGEDSAFFAIVGEKFECGFDVKYGGVAGVEVKNGIQFSGAMGHAFRIVKPL